MKQNSRAGKTFPAFWQRLVDLSLINVTAERTYEPREYPGKIVLFRAEETDYENSRGLLALAQGGVEIHKISGDHDTFLKEPHVRQLARAHQESIDLCVPVHS